MKRGTILLAEDNRRLRRLYTDSLRLQGYDVHDFETGESLLAQVGATSPDLVVLDISMPGVGGIEVCRRARHSLNPHIPVLILTGFEDPELVEQAFAAGADDFIVKSGTLDSILERVDIWIERSGIANLSALRSQVLNKLKNRRVHNAVGSA
ncbi:MAG: response regulator [Alphaproteobacteria bacterium]